jgi:hypothetical protein
MRTGRIALGQYGLFATNKSSSDDQWANLMTVQTSDSTANSRLPDSRRPGMSLIVELQLAKQLANFEYGLKKGEDGNGSQTYHPKSLYRHGGDGGGRGALYP